MKEKILQTRRRLLSLLLAAVLLFPTHAATVMAGTLQAGATAEAAGAASPANPVHHCTKKNDGTDTTDWSYVYFGSYPQTEVTGADLTAAVIGADYDANGDTWVNGTKYRRIRKSDTNYNGYFGNSAYRYFKWERIKWRVLKNDGSTLFVVADKGIDCKNYNEAYTSVTWESCTLRSWLNSDFYATAFGSNEQSAVVSRTVANEDNSIYGTEGGNDTEDKVYLLSIGEVTNPNYGFCEECVTDSASRWMQVSDYAHARGAYTYNSNKTGGRADCWWWLRSPGFEADNAVRVYDLGIVHINGYKVGTRSGAVVPALHINFFSDLWSVSDDGTSGEGGRETDGSSDMQNDSSSVQKVKKLSISSLSQKIAAGKKITLFAVIFPENASDARIIWKSSNKNYASVNSKGVVTTKKAGAGKSVTITAAAADGSGIKAKIKLKLMRHAVTKVRLTAQKKTLEVGASMKFKATVKTNGKYANKALKWTSSNPSYAAVSSKGKVTAKKTGKGKTVTITAMSTDGTNKKSKVKLKIR